MAIRIDIKRTDFYNELPKDKQREYFNLKCSKFLPSIDNIYYGVYLKDDCKGNTKLTHFFLDLAKLKAMARESHNPIPYGNGLFVDALGFKGYGFCISNPDLYDIFMCSNIPNDKTPRIVVQLRAFGLWAYGADKMLSDSYEAVQRIFEPLGFSISKCRENRVDYCYHTNYIQNSEKVFSDSNAEKQLTTTLEEYQLRGRNLHLPGGGTVFLKDYYALGSRNSNNVVFRAYNKSLEVVEMGYKGFFFEIWHKKGLISFYDKYCLEKALLENNYNAIHKARLEFYIEYGENERVKREFEILLADKNTTLKDCKELADSYMPAVTIVMNIEFETKRKFYYYSDKFIDNVLKASEERKDVPGPLKRLYKITDNRHVFLDYLTSVTVCFQSKGKYAAWWERLRNTKLDGLKVDLKLIRDYSSDMDDKLVKRRVVNSLVTNSVYSGRIETDFVEDMADMLSNLNDNNAKDLRFLLYDVKDCTAIQNLDCELLANYFDKKVKKYYRVRNRIKQRKIKEEADGKDSG